MVRSMRYTLALLLVAACSSDPTVNPSDGSAGDVGADAPSSDAPAGSCPEGQRWCSMGGDLCFAPGTGESALSCVPNARTLGCALPPPCGICPRGARLWRRADLEAHNAARAATGMCPDYGDAGVPVSTIRE